MLIVFEGLPGAGKTTTISALKSLFPCSVIPEVIEPEPINADESFFIQNDINKYQLAEQYGRCIMDRNFASTLCFNFSHDAAYGTNLYPAVSRKIHEMLEQNIVHQPDMYVYFTCSKSTSLRRQNASNNANWQDSKFLESTALFYEHFFTKQRVPTITINTDMHSVEETKIIIARSVNAQAAGV